MTLLVGNLASRYAMGTDLADRETVNAIDITNKRDVALPGQERNDGGVVDLRIGIENKIDVHGPADGDADVRVTVFSLIAPR